MVSPIDFSNCRIHFLSYTSSETKMLEWGGGRGHKKQGFNMREKGFSQTTKVLLLLDEVHPGFFPAEFCNKNQGK